MTKDELIKHMEKVLEEVIVQDEEHWGLDEFEEDLDRAWQHGYMSAINTVKEMLND